MRVYVCDLCYILGSALVSVKKDWCLALEPTGWDLYRMRRVMIETFYSSFKLRSLRCRVNQAWITFFCQDIIHLSHGYSGTLIAVENMLRYSGHIKHVVSIMDRSNEARMVILKPGRFCAARGSSYMSILSPNQDYIECISVERIRNLSSQFSYTQNLYLTEIATDAAILETRADDTRPSIRYASYNKPDPDIDNHRNATHAVLMQS
jgi:hypothetical protein